LLPADQSAIEYILHPLLPPFATKTWSTLSLRNWSQLILQPLLPPFATKTWSTLSLRNWSQLILQPLLQRRLGRKRLSFAKKRQVIQRLPFAKKTWRNRMILSLTSCSQLSMQKRIPQA
jgi:hypothetical protein